MSVKVEWDCPYCDELNHTYTEMVTGMIIDTCNVETGGCGRRVALSIAVRADATALRIEGEDSEIPR